MTEIYLHNIYLTVIFFKTMVSLWNLNHCLNSDCKPMFQIQFNTLYKTILVVPFGVVEYVNNKQKNINTPAWIIRLLASAYRLAEFLFLPHVKLHPKYNPILAYLMMYRSDFYLHNIRSQRHIKRIVTFWY